MSIPKGAFEYNGHYYYYYKGTKTWKQAQSACKKLGGHLVTFSDAKEEAAVWDYVKKYDTTFYNVYHLENNRKYMLVIRYKNNILYIFKRL